MAATNSTQKLKSPFLTNLHLELRQNLLFAILISILHFTGLPLILYAAKEIANLDQRGTPVPEEEYLLPQSLMIFGIISLVIALVLVILHAIRSYSYVCSKARTDMIYSLPMNHAQRFFSTYLSGVMLWLPAAILSAILSMYLYQQIPTEYDVAYKSTLFILIPLIELWIYTMIIFCVNACGKLNAAAITCGVLAILFPILLMIANGYIAMLQGRCFSQTADCLMIGIAGPPIYVLNMLTNGYYFDVENLGVGKTFLCIAINTLLYLGGAYLLHRKRKAEYAGTAFPFRALYSLIQFVLAAFIPAIYFIFVLDNGGVTNVIPLFLISFLLAMLAIIIFDFIGEPNLRRMKKRIARYLIIASASTAAVALVIFTGGFGLAKLIPSANHISAIETDYDVTIPLTDPEIQEILSASHKKTIEHHQEHLTYPSLTEICPDCENSDERITVFYQNGTNTAAYNVELLNLHSAEIFDAIRKSDAYNDAHVQLVKKLLHNPGAEIILALNDVDATRSQFSDEEIDRILEAYRADIERGCPPFADPDYGAKPCYIIDGYTPKNGRWYRHLIPLSCTRTAQVLTELLNVENAFKEAYAVETEYFEKQSTVTGVAEILDSWKLYADSAPKHPLTYGQIRRLMPYLEFYDGNDTSQPVIIFTTENYDYEIGELCDIYSYFTLTPEGQELLQTMIP